MILESQINCDPIASVIPFVSMGDKGKQLAVSERGQMGPERSSFASSLINGAVQMKGD